MEKQYVPAPDTRAVPPPSFYLKVKLSCCEVCPRKAKKELLKLNGVVGISIDTEKGLIAVSGTADPQVLVQKFAKWGKKAEVLLPPENADQTSRSNPINQDSSSDDNDFELKTKSQDGIFHWQNPALPKEPINDSIATEPEEVALGNKKNKKNRFLRWLSKKKKEIQLGCAASAFDGDHPYIIPDPLRKPGIILPPNNPMSAYGLMRPNNFGYGNPHHYPPMAHRNYHRYPPMARPPYPYNHAMRQPGNGFPQNWSPPRHNPMIHYSNYADNYNPYI